MILEISNAPNDGEEGATLPYLGGLGAEASNRILQDSTYGRLPRPTVIPHKENSRLVVGPPKDLPAKAQTIYSTLWNGDFACHVNTQADSHLIVKAMVRGEPAIICSIFFQRGQPVSVVPHVNTTTLDSLLGDSQAEMLYFRILHRLMRSHGYRLPPDFIVGIRCLLLGWYVKKKRFREALDLAIIAADIAINSASGTDKERIIYNSLMKVGEVLETKGKFRQAAEVYLEMISVWKCCPGDYQKNACTVNAGLAYERGGEYEVAEQQYLKVLAQSHGSAGAAWNATVEGLSMNIIQMLVILYVDMVSAILSTGPTDSDYATVQAIFAFLGLLHIAGFQPQQDNDLCAAFRLCGPTCSDSLKDKFASSPKQAKRALLVAFQSANDLERFRSQLMSCSKPKKGIFVQHWPMRKRNHKTAARDHVASVGQVESIETCSEPSCATIAIGTAACNATFKCCPCKTKQYCSKECQVRHWKEGGHKLSCPARRRRDQQTR